MNPFSISGLLIGLNSLTLGILVLFRNPDKKLRRTWFLFTLTAAIWGFGVMAVGLSTNQMLSLWIWRASYAVGVVWIAPLFYHFVCVFLDLKRKRSILFHYGVGFIFVLNLGSHAFFKNIEWVFNSFYYVRAGWLYGVYFGWWILLVSFSHIDMMRIYPSVAENKKNQIKYFFLATMVGYSGGVLSYLPKFGIDIYPWGNFLVCLYPIIMGYAILKYNLMDVRIFIRRTGLLIGIYALLLMAAAPLIFSFHRSFFSGLQHSPLVFWLQIVTIAGILSLGPFLYAYLVRTAYWLRGHLTAGLTHELKSPLSNIQSAIAIIEEELKNPAVDKSKSMEYVEMVQSNASRLEAFVKDLLSIAKINEGNIVVEKAPFDFTILVEKVLNDYKPMAHEKGIHLVNLIQEPLVVTADKEKMGQVLSNLISNAIKFSNGGKVEVQASKTGAQLQCSVSDEGCGIPQKDHKRVFDRFYQAHPNAKGSGLGLSIAKAWVEAHGGRIWVESRDIEHGAKIIFIV